MAPFIITLTERHIQFAGKRSWIMSKMRLMFVTSPFFKWMSRHCKMNLSRDICPRVHGVSFRTVLIALKNSCKEITSGVIGGIFTRRLSATLPGNGA